MGYQLGFDTLDDTLHPSFRYESMDEARGAARIAIDNGYHEARDTGVMVTTGPGMVYKMVSEDHLAEQQTTGSSTLAPFSWVLVVQVPHELAFGFHHEREMTDKMREAQVTGVFNHCAKIGHEYTCIQGIRGFVYVPMTKSEFLDRQHRLAVAMQQQKAAEDAKKVRILPSSRG